MFLTKTELADLTGRQKCSAQARALRLMGIEHRLRPDGSVAVLRAHVEQVLGGGNSVTMSIKQVEPNWGAI